ncbi:MAG TPA: hypothetical protein P5056_00740 [Candidatus Paceibacterota bacterium]|nr:hypothetical protein [Candidatus Paceibacterota bacterium]
MEKIIGTKELRNNLDDYIAKIQKGASFLVVRRSKPVFKISSPVAEDERWEEVVDFTKLKKGGLDIDDLLSRLEKCNG